MNDLEIINNDQHEICQLTQTKHNYYSVTQLWTIYNKKKKIPDSIDLMKSWQIRQICEVLD